MIKDRLKYRCFVNLDLDTGESAQFYVYPDSVYNDDYIGVSKQLIVDTINELNISEGFKDEIWDYIENDDFVILDSGIIEQCIGIKDSKGQYI